MASNGLKPKDLIGIPWMVAFALRADGWWLRAECIWAKPSCMPESVTDRPTRAHETVFLLSKSSAYFYDADAVREPYAPDSVERVARGRSDSHKWSDGGPGGQTLARDISKACSSPIGRNMRSVWTITTEPFKGAHFAVMPTALAERCVKAGTSEKGCCPACGAPWARVVEREPLVANAACSDERKPLHGPTYSRHKVSIPGGQSLVGYATKTTGWEPGCSCAATTTLPCTVLDPFAGAGTTLLVASRLQRRAIGIELDERSLRMAADRISDDATLFAGVAA